MKTEKEFIVTYEIRGSQKAKSVEDASNKFARKLGRHAISLKLISVMDWETRRISRPEGFL